MQRARTLAGAVVATVALTAAAGLWAHEKGEELPPGPIRDRHERMEAIGDLAKKINDALKHGENDVVAENAAAIAEKAKNIAALFPEGSVHPNSRAKPEIWQHWEKFERLAEQLPENAAALAAAARGGGDVSAASKKLFGTCKSCHDEFRQPED
jgi:cytochrome c556